MKNLQQHLTIKNILVLTVLVISVIIISCTPAQKEAKPEQVQQQIEALQTIVEPEIPATGTSVQENAPVGAEQTSETVMLNPPHGEPFHRCDIPVGSPLNTVAPATTNTATSIQNASPSIENASLINNSLVNNSTAPELNPPHGQPFHRCDIAVGSPLNSAPPATTATTTSSIIQRTGTSPTIENAARLNNSLANNPTAPTFANSVAPKINPPHGQPFHRCDIAVGSPLPVN